MTELKTQNGSLTGLALDVHATARAKGFWDLGVNDEVIGTKLALLHSEVTEVLEAVRKERGAVAIVEEMADVLIRLLDLYAGMRLDYGLPDLDDALAEKAAKNARREHKHGHRF